MTRRAETTTDYSTLVMMKSFMENEIRDYTIIATQKIQEGKLDRKKANCKRAMLVSILKLINKVLKAETTLRPQMNLFNISQFEKQKQVL